MYISERTKRGHTGRDEFKMSIEETLRQREKRKISN